MKPWLWILAGIVLLAGGGAAAETLASSPAPAPGPSGGDSPDGEEDASNTEDDPTVITYIDKWAAAIQAHEGWTPGSRSYRNNNPGNLQYAGQTGSTGKDEKGFAIFPTYDLGLAALKRQLRKYVADHPGYSILNIMALYLGNKDPLHPAVTDQGDPFAYAGVVAAMLEVPVNTTLGNLEATQGAELA